MPDAAYDAWAHETRKRLSSLLIANTSVPSTPAPTATGSPPVTSNQTGGTPRRHHRRTHVVTGRNDRHLANRDGIRFVKNGDTWTVKTRHRNGDLTVASHTGSRVGLPYAYVTKHVELG